MPWLPKVEPATLYQSSDIPYVISENEVILCFDNSFALSKSLAVSNDHQICFRANKSNLERQSANFYRFSNFPVSIKFNDIIYLDNTIIEGRIIKNVSPQRDDTLFISLIKQSYLDNLSSFQRFVEQLDAYDHTFILLTDDISPEVRLLDEMVTVIPKTNDWGRICVTIANTVCKTRSRKYAWTQCAPGISLDCYGMDDSDETCALNDMFSLIGIDSDIKWETLIDFD